MQTPQFIATLLITMAVVIETIISSVRQLKLYDKRDSITNFFLGAFAVITGLIMRCVALWLFMSIQPFVLFHIPFTFASGILLFLLSDLQYYWFHRLGHVSRFFWASHVIHHSSHQYNYSVGMRLPFTNGFYRFLFWLPICLIGFPPGMVILMDALVNYYTFFLHTETIGKLGWFEKFLNTPSHHRVHHSSNPQYLDKNFGGVLIIWDKLFGTFIREEEKTKYGLTKSFHSYNPVTIVFDEWRAMIIDLKNARGANEILKVVLGSPAWKPKEKKTSVHRSATKKSTGIYLKKFNEPKKDSLPPKQIIIKTISGRTILFSILVLCSSFSDNDSADWILRRKENGIAVYTRNTSGSALKEVRVVNRVKSSLSGIVALLLDTKNYPNWMIACKEAKILKVINEHELYNYQVTHLPWPCNDRDVVSYFRITQDEDTRIVSFTKTAMPQFIPAKAGLVRVSYFQTRYVLTPLSSDSVQIEMEMRADPGGSIPDWLINANIVSAPYRTTLQMTSQLPGYQSVFYSFIKEK